MNITLKFKQTKSGYHQFEATELRGVVYFAKAAFEDPSKVTVTVDGALAAPTAAKTVDPEKLKAAAEKAEKIAKRNADRASRLQAQLAALTANAAPAADETPAEQTPAEETPAEETPAEEPVVEPVAPAANAGGQLRRGRK